MSAETVEAVERWLGGAELPLVDGPSVRQASAVAIAAQFEQFLLARGETATSEAAGTLQGWLETEVLRMAPAEWVPHLESALALGLEMYSAFMAGFNQIYLDPEGRGLACVRRALRRHLGYATPALEEVVLERIRDRRRHLLDALRRKYQPSLFGVRGFDSGRVEGYLVRVALIESRRAADEYRPSGAGALANLANLPAPAEDNDPLDGGGRMAALAGLLVSFWGRKNGFSKEQRLEGLVSLALGAFTGNAVLGRRCLEFLEERLPPWEAELARLDRLAGNCLHRINDARGLLAGAGADRARLEGRLRDLEDARIRLDQRRTRHLTRLRPRPADVARLLAGIATTNLSNTRFKRVAREIALFEERTRAGIESLGPFGAALPPAAADLLASIAAHLAERPASERAHGLSAPERECRRAATARWLDRAEELRRELARARVALPISGGAAPPWADPLAGWLADAEDFYEFGLLTRKGVVEAFGRRRGLRLARLLRAGL